MVKIIFSIKDNKSGLFANPITAVHKAEVIRGLQSAIKKEGIPFNTHTQDFEMYQLGTIEDQTGLITPEKSPIHVINLIDLKEITDQ